MEEIKKLEAYLDEKIMNYFYPIVLGNAMEVDIPADSDDHTIESIIELYTQEGWFIHKTEGNQIKMRSKIAQMESFS